MNRPRSQSPDQASWTPGKSGGKQADKLVLNGVEETDRRAHVDAFVPGA
ncbi:MAG: hypothetical protein WAN65_12805 [Candidatus Sulfotelmatobacter sp.]